MSRCAETKIAREPDVGAERRLGAGVRLRATEAASIGVLFDPPLSGMLDVLQVHDICGRTGVAIIRYVYDVAETLCCVLLSCSSNSCAICILEIAAEDTTIMMNLHSWKRNDADRT